MENQIIPNNDIQFLASRTTENLNVIVAGMTSLMEENNQKITMLENQDWFQRMSYTITGQNKMTQKEIEKNHDKINLYVTQALGELYDQNCINNELILGLGNKINSLYASQVEIKQIIGAFAQKLNQKIESIDRYHMLVTEINQGVYKNKNSFISICQILSQLDLRTVKDDRKMDILVRAMEEQEILKENKVTISDMLKELLELSDNEAGILIMFLGNIRADMLADIMEQIMYSYYTLPEFIRPNINKNSIIENILKESSLDQDKQISTHDLYMTLIKVYVNNIIEVAIEEQKNGKEEKKKYIEDYLNNVDSFISTIDYMSETWDANFGELNTESDRREYADFLLNLIENIDFNSYIGNSIIENLNVFTSFIQTIFAKISDLRINEVDLEGEKSAKVNRNAAIWLDYYGRYMTITEYYKECVNYTLFDYMGIVKDNHRLKDMLGDDEFPNYFTFQNFKLNFCKMRYYYALWIDTFVNISDKIEDDEFIDELYNICSTHTLELDDEYEDILIRKINYRKPHIEFIYKSAIGNKLQRKIGYFDIGTELLLRKYDEIRVGINVRNLNYNGSITLSRNIIQNFRIDTDSMSSYKYVDVEWGDSNDCDFEIIIYKNNDFISGYFKMKVYVKEYPDIVGYLG